MPSAEPVPTPDQVGDLPGTNHAQIIPLAPRGTGRRSIHRSGGQAADMTSSDEPADQDDDGIHRRLGESIEMRFLEQHQTLADPRALAAFLVAMDLAQSITAGAQAQGIVTADQQGQLADLFEGAKRAASLVGDA